MILELILCAILFLLGITYTFWGYKNLKKLIALGTGIITFICTFYITIELGIVASIVISLVVAIIAAILSHFFFNIGLFLIGAGLGSMVSMIIASFIPLDNMVIDIFLTAFFSILFGIFAIKSKRVYISAATSFTGAAVCCTSLATIIFAVILKYPGLEATIAFMKTYSIVLWACSIILGLIGFIVQLAVTAPKNK